MARGLTTLTQGDLDTPFLYNGQMGVQTDPNGLLQMRARYYSPHLMRFLNADPIGFSGGSNWFAYADGNPVSLSDPFGLCAESRGGVDYQMGRYGALGGYGLGQTQPGSWIQSNGTEVDIHGDAVVGIHNIGLFFRVLGNTLTSKEVWARNLESSAKNPANWMAGFGGGGLIGAFTKGPADDLVRVTGAAKSGVTATQPNRIYSARELIRRADEPGPFHNFPESFNAEIFQSGTKTVTPNFWRTAKPNMSNDSIMYSLPGQVNGRAGVFEIGVRPSASGNTEVIMHRFFRPNP